MLLILASVRCRETLLRSVSDPEIAMITDVKQLVVISQENTTPLIANLSTHSVKVKLKM